MRSTEVQRSGPVAAVSRAVPLEDPARSGAGRKTEGPERLDQLAEPVAINAVGPIRPLDQHPSGQQSTRVERDHGTLDPQGSDRVDLTTGVGRKEMDQLDPQLAAEGLRRGVHAHRCGDGERQTFRHPSIVPLATTYAAIFPPSCLDNSKLTTEDHVMRVESHRAGSSAVQSCPQLGWRTQVVPCRLLSFGNAPSGVSGMDADWTACRQRLVGAHDRACHSTLKLAAVARDASLVGLTALADGSRVAGLSTGGRQRVISRVTPSQGGCRGETTHPHSAGGP